MFTFKKLILLLVAFGILLELNFDTVYLFQIGSCLSRISVASCQSARAARNWKVQASVYRLTAQSICKTNDKSFQNIENEDQGKTMFSICEVIFILAIKHNSHAIV